MIGMTRSRVSFFMNKFCKLGLVAYNRGALSVHSSHHTTLEVSNVDDNERPQGL
jgi:hypothetical protein